MDKSKCAGMQCVSRANRETIFHELFVPGKYGSFYNFIAAIEIIVEQRMAYVLHVDADLVGATCFKDTFHQRDVPESFHNFIMGNGLLAVLALRISFKQFTESLMTAHMCRYRSFVLFYVTPNQGQVLPFDGVFITLSSELA